MPLAPVDLLAAIIPTLGTTHLGGLDRLAIDADGARRGLAPRLHAGLLTQCLDHFSPCPVVAPLGKVVIDSAFGQQIVGKHIPFNWLQVLGTTETPHIDQGVRHQFHPVVTLLDVLETEKQALEFVLPRKRPLDALP